MVGLDLTKFKKVGGNAHHTVLQHTDGHQLHLDHKRLPHPLAKELSQMPNAMSKGGEAEEPETQPTPILGSGRKGYAHAGEVEPDIAPRTPADQDTGSTVEDVMPNEPDPAAARQFGLPNGPQGIMTGVAAGAPSALVNQANGVQAQNPDPMGLGEYESALRSGQAQLEQGIQGQANAAGAQGQAEARIAGSSAAQAQQMLQDYQQHQAYYMDQHDKFMKDLEATHIDPNHWMASRTDSQRTNAMIGMFLSGLGSGITGRPNIAQGIIQGAIDRDMQAQEKNLGIKQTLLEANMRMFGDVRSGYAATRAQLQDIYNMRIAQAAAQSKNPMAQAIAQQEIAKSRMGIAQTYQQIAAQKALTAGGATDPWARINMIPDPKERAEATKEMGISEKTAAAHAAVDQVVSKLGQLQTYGNYATNPIQAPKQAAALRAQLVPLIMEASPSKRLTHESLAAEIDPLIPSFISNGDTRKALRQQLHNLVDTHADQTPTLQRYRIAHPQYNPIQFGAVK